VLSRRVIYSNYSAVDCRLTDWWVVEVFCVQTMWQLRHMNLPVSMSPTVAWTLNRTHVKVAFRMCVSTAIATSRHGGFNCLSSC